MNNIRVINTESNAYGVIIRLMTQRVRYMTYHQCVNLISRQISKITNNIARRL